MPEPRATATGPGRILIAVYGIFALSASARAGVQIAERFGEAPLAWREVWAVVQRNSSLSRINEHLRRTSLPK